MPVLPIDRASSEPVDRVEIRTTLPLRGVRTVEIVGQIMMPMKRYETRR